MGEKLIYVVNSNAHWWHLYSTIASFLGVVDIGWYMSRDETTAGILVPYVTSSLSGACTRTRRNGSVCLCEVRSRAMKTYAIFLVEQVRDQVMMVMWSEGPERGAEPSSVIQS